jgi:glycerol-3-phosphate acyltransferase PlsY
MIMDNMLNWPASLFILGAYLLGAVPFGLLVVRIARHQDVRDQGSGNIGATNVARVAGQKLGAVTLLMDALKGWAPVVVGRSFGLDDAASACAGAAAFLGHCFPVYLRFRGGKGIATGLGVIMGTRPLVAVVAVGVFLAAFVVTRISSLSCLLGMVAVAVLAYFTSLEPELLGLLAAMLGVSILKLWPNIRRLIAGHELRL